MDAATAAPRYRAHLRKEINVHVRLYLLKNQVTKEELDNSVIVYTLARGLVITSRALAPRPHVVN